jgi:hypothetical protein
MKIYTTIITLLALLFMAACSNDIDTSTSDEGGQAIVDIHLSARSERPAAPASRAVDVNAVDEEMMKNYVIIIAQGNDIKRILTKENLSNAESDEYAGVHLDEGTYTFYSFANISLADLGLTDDATKLPDGFDTKTFAVSGNQTAIDNFTDGIPMSNKQTITVEKKATEVDLEVVRMVAKMQLNLTNVTGSDIKVTQVQLSDITDDGTSEAPNLYLLPTDKVAGVSCTPHLANTATRSTLSYDVPTDQQTVKSGKGTTSLTFYLNESQAQDPSQFELTLTTQDADGTTTKKRYAILNWTEIARNDYRVIPITLDDYKLTFDVQYFTAIGVLPPTVTDDGQTLDLDFSYYGDIHLVPKIKKWSDDSDVTSSITHTYATDCWTRVTGTNPDGFFATAPYWNSTNNWVEASLGFTEGSSAVYRLLCTITKTDGTTETLTRNVRFKMTPMSFGAKAATRAADRTNWHWITVSVPSSMNK